MISKARHIKIKNIYNQDGLNSQMFEEIINSFEDQSDSLAATCGKVKYVHPELRIGIIESSSLRRVHAAHQIRILKARAPVSLSSKELAVRIKKLLTHVDRFHCQLLVQFENVGRVVSIPEAGVRRRNLSMWLIQSMIKPTDSLPIHGLVPIKSDRPPWDQLFTEDSSSKLFGPVQREVIRLLSDTSSTDLSGDGKSRWETGRALLVVIWYSHHFPGEMKELTDHYKTARTKKRKINFDFT
jgi:hypothetical protein